MIIVRRSRSLRPSRRSWLYEKLERVMGQIENEELPMSIKEVHLFGSFLKGKEEPKDIDIVLIYDSEGTVRKYEEVGRNGSKHWRFWDLRRAPSRLRGQLKENAERTVDLTICPSLEEFKRDLTKDLDICLRIWSVDDGDWRSKVREHLGTDGPLTSRRPRSRSPRGRSASRCRSPRTATYTAPTSPRCRRRH